MDEKKLELAREKAQRRRMQEARRQQREVYQKDMGLGYLLWVARRHARLAQADLARRIGSSPSAISRWERGTRRPSLSTIQMVAEVTGLDLIIGLRSKREGTTLVQGRLFDEGPLTELHLEEDVYITDALTPAHWRVKTGYHNELD
jgi:transcriptional regulator with XRE-family HTH domain